VPGAQAGCACPNAGQGVQVCSDAGDRFGPCDCAGVHAPVSAPEAPRLERRSESGFHVGLALTIFGGIAFSVGASWLIAQMTSDFGSGCTLDSESTSKCVIAGTIGGLGTLGLAVGIPMMVVNGRMVPAAAGTTGASWWQPTSVALGRSSLRVGWAF